MQPSLILALAGLLLVLGTWLAYLAAIPREWVPRRPRVHAGAMLSGAVLSVAGALGSLHLASGISIPAAAAATAAAILAIYFFWLLGQAAQPDVEPAIRVGEPLPRFTCLDEAGDHFDSGSLSGQRVFLKLFRGHW